ncbi:beta strand repeat-containing protein [Aestuariivirga sp.]|uniref:beta strand repeat-containing protein n=1 Tax=Aestuariivirga sp. TaxID=2650926 RepID=UPI00359306AD
MSSVQLIGAFDMTNSTQSDFILATVSSTAEFYGWSTTGDFRILVISPDDDITVNGASEPTGGTASGVMAFNGSGQTIYTVTGFSAPLTAMLDISSSAAFHETYWETLLTGATSFSAAAEGVYRLVGDFIQVGAAQTATGAADTFEMLLGSSMRLFGDALGVGIGGTLTGGADRFTIGNGGIVGAKLSGDVDTHVGTVIGGADIIAIKSGLGADSAISGDALISDGVLTGGADRISISLVATIATPDYIVTGDAVEALRQVTGGNDTIVIRPFSTDIPVVAISLSGDVITAATANSFVTGGDDVITSSVVSGGIAGDVASQSAGVVIAGDDTITLNSATGTTIAGDVFNFTGGTLTPGNDNIKGGSGDDIIFGESSTPNFPGTLGTTVNAGGNDIIDGREGNDTIKGQVGNDILTGGAGNDIVDGGSGIDTATFDTLSSAVFVDLTGIAGMVTSQGFVKAIGQGLDVLDGIENVTGSALNDTIKGDGAGNVLNGGSGSDTLNGRGGTDTLIGGRGQDKLNGGGGNDIFDFNAVNELSANSTKTDIIIGFATGDKIDISDIATGKGNVNAPFTFQTTALTGVGQVTFATSGSDVIVSGSTDSDAAAEFTILLKGVGTLTAADFIL